MKFQVGEIAEKTVDGHGANAGDLVEIVAVGPFPIGTQQCKPDPDGLMGHNVGWPADYQFEAPDGRIWFCNEKSLRKRYPPGSEIAMQYMLEADLKIAITNCWADCGDGILDD